MVPVFAQNTTFCLGRDILAARSLVLIVEHKNTKRFFGFQPTHQFPPAVSAREFKPNMPMRRQKKTALFP